MRKEIWMHAQTNLPETLEKHEYVTLTQYASDNKEHIMDVWYNSDSSSFAQTVRYGNSQLKHFEHYLEKNSKGNAVFQLGTLMGVIKTLNEFFQVKEEENLNAKIYQKQISSTKHLKDIVLLLEAHGIMTHSEICQNLGLKESTLSEIMKKSASTNLILSTKAGKYKLYRLSDNGRHLSRQLRTSSPDTPDKETLLRLLSYYLEIPQSKDSSFEDKVKELLVSHDIENPNVKITCNDTIKIKYNDNSRIQQEELKVMGFPLNQEKSSNNIKTFIIQKLKFDNDILDDIDNNSYYKKAKGF